MPFITPITAIADGPPGPLSPRAFLAVSTVMHLLVHGDCFLSSQTDNERFEPQVAGLRAMRRVRGRAARAHLYCRVRMSSARGARRERALSARSNHRIPVSVSVHIGYQCMIDAGPMQWRSWEILRR